MNDPSNPIQDPLSSVASPCDPPTQTAAKTIGENFCEDLPEPVPQEDPEVFRASGTDPDPDPQAAPDEASSERLALLREELTALREELAASRREQERLSREYGEFCSLFPDVTADRIPPSVRSAVQEGVPLAAAYALEEHRQKRLSDTAEQANRSNRRRSAGPVCGGGNEFYTREEVRAMSRSEVRANLQKIMLSMKKW